MSVFTRRFLYQAGFFILIFWVFSILFFFQLNDSSKDLNTDLLLEEHHDSQNLADNFHKKFNQPQLGKDHDIQNHHNQTNEQHSSVHKADAEEHGEMGKPVVIIKKHLSSSDAKRYQDGFKKHAFNEYASELISLHRTLPDHRHPDCHKKNYSALKTTASIVMCFHNEAWSTLLRSIHSVINRSPSHLLKEIILVDDFSDMAHLKRPLDDYVKMLKIVTIVRLKRREGLIRARLAGATLAKADVIIFLDSHIEAADGWFEPLIEPIEKDRTTVVTPVIDTLDDVTFEYTFIPYNTTYVGGFDWNLEFKWHRLPASVLEKRKSPADLVKSPTMAGGLFAVNKMFFYDLGSYDSGMDIWGGENLEISFRIWMCGGSLMIAPCSHVGHIFRSRSPYSWANAVDSLLKNGARVAEVWLDEYKNYYYERLNFMKVKYGDVSARQALRDRLHCKPFKWYLTEVYPELPVRGPAVALGEIRALSDNICIDAQSEKKRYGRPARTYECHYEGGNQFFILSEIGEIRRDQACFEYEANATGVNKDDKVFVAECNSTIATQHWVYNENDQLYHPASSLCLGLSSARDALQMQVCNGENAGQRWIWKREKAANHT